MIYILTLAYVMKEETNIQNMVILFTLFMSTKIIKKNFVRMTLEFNQFVL